MSIEFGAVFISTLSELLYMRSSDKDIFPLIGRIQASVAQAIIDDGLFVALFAEVKLVIHRS
jgi:hypothetical protein